MQLPLDLKKPNSHPRRDTLGASKTSVYSLVALPLLLCIATCVPIQRAEGQTLNVNMDGHVGSGLLGSSNAEGTNWDRLPSFVGVNTALVFDEDTSLEYVLGVIVQVEQRAAVALVPKIRLVKPVGMAKMYASVGVPWFVSPFRRLGGELGGGIIVPASHVFSWIGGAGIQAFFAGADVPDGSTVLAFNMTFGARLSF